ncbi:MAG: DUF4129 domain-containing protein [Azonexus sp.]|jgi:hypothetical protein|nr:DUF4129 domain-containing protein [Azonexus sp.]
MCFERRAWLRAALFALLVATACARAETPAAPASREQVAQEIERLRDDPLLGRSEMKKTLRFKERQSKTNEAPKFNPAWDWLFSFSRWLADSARVLMWVLGAFLAVFILVGLRRWLGLRGPAEGLARAAPPSHVQSLDIRPESLPDDIGAAAALLWQRGEQRAALSLLYRGALSRLVHVHTLPIRAASTEGDCLRLARARLDAPRAGFFTRLVGVWQYAVYGAQMPANEQALALCHEFDAQLPAALPEAAQ